MEIYVCNTLYSIIIKRALPVTSISFFHQMKSYYYSRAFQGIYLTRVHITKKTSVFLRGMYKQVQKNMSLGTKKIIISLFIASFMVEEIPRVKPDCSYNMR